MKITRLTVRDFRTIEYTEVDFTDTNLLLGLNGQGKSSILNAIQMALHGWCEHTTRSGGGYRDLIRTGAKQAVIELDFHAANMKPKRIICTLGCVARAWEVIDIHTGSEIETLTSPVALWQALKINQQHAAVCMFPAAMVHAAEFSGILSSFLANALTPAAMVARIPQQHVAALTAMAKSNGVNLDTVAGFETLGKFAYEKRTVINRDVKLVDAVIAETGFLKPVTDPATGLKLGPNVMPAMRDEIKRVQAVLRDLYTARGRAEQAPQDMPDIAALTAAVKNLSEHHAAAEGYESAQRAAVAAQTAMDAANAAARAASEILTDPPKTCPTCGGKLSKAKREELTAESTARHAAAVAESGAAQAVALKQNQAAAAWLESLTAPGEPAAVLAERVREARIALAAAERVPAPYTGPSLAEIDADIATNQARVTSLESLCVALEQHKQLAEAKAHAAALREQLEPLSVAITEFHDGVAYRALLADAAAPIVDAVNNRIPGTLEIQADGKAFAMLYNGRRLSLASKGEQALVAFGMADAFAACGAPCLMDDTDSLDPYARGDICMALRESATGTIIMAGTPNSVDDDYPARLRQLLAPMRVITISSGSAKW